MKTIRTNISELEFIYRLENMCCVYSLFEKKYADLDTFVVKRKGHKFRIGCHWKYIWYASGRSGYSNEFLFGEYQVNESGKVDITYHFGQPFSFMLPYICCCAVAGPIFLAVVYNALFTEYIQWGGMAVTGLITFVGIFMLLRHPKKTRAELENHLKNICGVND